MKTIIKKIEMGAVAALAVLFMLSPSARAEAEQEAQPEARTIVTVKQLLDSPADYADKNIVAVGMFMGGDGACAGRMDRNDWMLQGEGRNCVWARGPLPEGCDAATKVGVGRTVAVEGRLAMIRNRPFLMLPRSANEARQKVEQQREQQLEARRQQQERTAQMLLDMDRQRAASVTFSPGDISQNPALFAGLEFTTTGKFRVSAKGCDGARAVDGEWALGDLSGYCMAVLGPIPMRADSGAPPAEGDLVSFKANVKIETMKDSKLYYLQALPRPKPEKSEDAKPDSDAKPDAPK